MSTMTVTLPAGTTGVADRHRELETLLRSLAGRLGAERLPAVTVRTGDDHAATVDVDGRPLAVGLTTAGGDFDFAEDLAARLLRRPGLLCGQPGPPATVAAYLADLGLRPGRADQPGASVPDRAEAAVDSIAPDEIVLEAPAAVLRQIGRDECGLVPKLRHRVLTGFGVHLPDIRLVPAPSTEPVLRIQVHDLVVPVRLTGAGAGWAEVVNGLSRTIRPRIHWFLRRRDVVAALDDLGYLMPDLVQSGTERYGTGTLTAVLREVVRHGGSIRNLGRIILLLLDLGGPAPGSDRLALTEQPRSPMSDSVVLAALLRKARAEEAWRIGTPRPPERAGRLHEQTETALTGRSAPASTQWAALAEIAGLGTPELVVTRSVQALPAVGWCLQALPHPPRVVASLELPPDADPGRLPVARSALTEGASS